MAHIEVEEKQGYQGQQDTQKHGKKKSKLTRKNIVVYGGIAIAVIIFLMVVMKRGQSSVAVQQEPIVLPPAEDGMPTAGMPIGGIPNYQEEMNNMKHQMALSNEQMLETMGNVFGKLQEGFDQQIGQVQNGYEQKLVQQQDKFDVFAQSNKDLLQQLQQKNVDDQQRYNEQLNYIQQQQQQQQVAMDTWQPAPQVNTIPPPTMPTIQGTVSSQNVATLRTGTFKSSQDAYKLLGRLQADYGATNGKVVKENGMFRVVSDFNDTSRANTVGERIKSLGYVQNYYTQQE
ncbi:hypothetical protein [Lysinibacillus xylanilyticus]|uniref:hypothetical protein n=1 Tax=Lysinibacillus xylanilyticus TaxID=582475 RepID=UPI003D06E3B3